MQGNTAGEIEPVDRQRSQIEGSVGRRQIDAARRIEAKIDRKAVDRQLVGPPLAAHQIAQTELDIELVGVNFAKIVGGADHHRAQPQ